MAAESYEHAAESYQATPATSATHDPWIQHKLIWQRNGARAWASSDEVHKEAQYAQARRAPA